MTSIFYFAINSPSEAFAIPEGVVTIQRHSFYGCISLSSLTIPSSVKVIGYNPFANCPSLSLTNLSPNFVYEDGVLYDRTRTTLMYYSASNTADGFVLPDSVRTIGRNAFFGCDNLKSVTIPDGVECISKGAFAKCGNLSKVNVPGSVTRVEDWAFYGCTGLTGLNLPKDAAVGERAFSHCNANIMLP